MKSVIGALAVFVVAGAGLLAGGAAEDARAATFEFTVEATGSNEVPSVSGPGSATGEFTFDDETNELEYRVTVDGLSEDEVTAAHIHSGAEGENGPILYTLSDEGFTEIEGSVQLTDDDVQALMDGELYLNVHSIDNPDGFARGQLELPAEATGDGTPEASPSPGMTSTPSSDSTPEASPTSEVQGQVGPPSTGDGGLAAEAGTGVAWPALAIVLSALALGSGALLIGRGRA